MPDYAPTSAPKSSMPTTANLPQPRDVALPDFTSNTYVSFGAVITGNISNTANMFAVWSPKETKFVLRGGYIHILCLTTCAGGGVHAVLQFYDEGLTQPVLPISTYHSTTTAAGWVNDIVPWHFDLGKGIKSKDKNNRLLIGGTADIGVGRFYCAGTVWGVQEL